MFTIMAEFIDQPASAVEAIFALDEAHATVPTETEPHHGFL